MSTFIFNSLENYTPSAATFPLASPFGCILTKTNSLVLQSLHDPDELLPALLDLFLLHIIHVIDKFQDTMYIPPPRFNAYPIRPAYLEMTDRAPVVLTDIEEPVEDVVVILCVEFDVVGVIEDGGCFVADGPTCSEEARVCGL